MTSGGGIPEILRRFEETMVETGRKLLDINLLLDELMLSILTAMEGNRVPLETDFPHYGAEGHRVLNAAEMVLDRDNGAIAVITQEGEQVPWEELGVSTKDFIANIIVLRLISDANYGDLRQ
jgi:hypothetical protein